MSLYKSNNRWYLFYLSALIIFILVYSVALNIPFHSDDYHYFLQGLSIENRINHYLNWSGRLITDFTSSYLLNLFSYPVYTAINSLVLLALLITVSLLPKTLINKNINSTSTTLILWIIFATYWIANPNLGQTTFWIVGSANYIWPLMWSGFYLIFIFYLLEIKKDHNIYTVLLLSILGILSGLSNESTGVSITFLSFILIFLYPNYKKITINGFISTLIGFLVLYLSPGNYSRLAHPAFRSWNEKDLFTKISDHLLIRMPNAISKYWFAWLVIAILIFIVYKNKKNIKEFLSNKKIFTPILFISLSVFSILVYIHSPAMPRRGLNTGLYFLLISISLFCGIILSSKKIKQITIKLLASVCILFFIPSYYLFYTATASTKIQHQIREEIIFSAQSDGQQSVEIPDWYFTKLFKSSDTFDKYRSGAMRKYYGIKEIKWVPAYFNYAILKKNTPIELNKNLIDDLSLKAIYVYDEIGSKNSSLMLEFNKNLTNYIKEGDNVLYAHLYQKGVDKFINSDLPINRYTKVGDAYYYRILLKGAKIEKLSKLNFGFYNSKTKKNSASFTIDLGTILLNK